MHTDRYSRVRAGLAFGCAAALLVLAACGGGGGGFEIFVRLISARFVPEAVSVKRGTTQRVELEVSCDRNALGVGLFALPIQVQLDPTRQLPDGVSATLNGGFQADPPDPGFTSFFCNGATADPDLMIARITVDVTATAAVAIGPATLSALVRIAPAGPGEPSKDGTLADLAIQIGGGLGDNLLVNPGFETAVEIGTQPTAPGYWRGDVGHSVLAENGIAPRSEPRMLKFEATGALSSTNTVASQQWQIVSLASAADAVAAGTLSADASIWFNRVTGDAGTDRRFDLRLIAFAGNPDEMPTRYAASNWLAAETATLITGGNAWQQALVSLAVPAAATYLLVEIYAYEDVVNDGEGAEFAGHYADDAVLVLRSVGP